MSFLISYQDLGMTFGGQTLFSDLSIGFSEGEKLGLVGANGSGKSTLLKIFAGEIQPDTGNRIERKFTRFEYLAQQKRFDPDLSIGDILEQAIADAGSDTESYNKGQRIIGQAGIPDHSTKVGTLSGGWKKRLAITCALVRQPDLLFLDEPTNHLDLEGILWLEQILQSATFSFVIVSHDRYLLENTTNRIVELGKVYPAGYLKVEGNYSEFLRRRDEFIENQQRQESTLANKMRRETEWLRRGPKARTTKAQFRIDSAHRLGETLDDIRRRNRHVQHVSIDFDSTGRKTRRLLEAFSIGISRGGDVLFNNLSFRLTPGTCIGLMGGNGTGKSTLMNIVNGTILPDTGDVKKADDLKIVLFDQEREQLDQEITLKKALAPDSDTIVYRGRPVHVVTWAKKFLFLPEQLDMPVNKLSGGEQARILIANLMKQPADILLLDEPTNDLDIQSLEILEESLSDFPGAIIVASHDRYFLGKLTTHILGFDGKSSVQLYADFEQWVSDLQKMSLKEKVKKEKATSEKVEGKPKKKFSYKHSFELSQIENKIETAEQELHSLQNAMNDPEVTENAERLQGLCERLGEAQKKVDDLYSRWEELEHLKGAE